MPRLTLLLGGAGSGKTHRVLTAVAEAALTGGLPDADHPPLLVLVPEQQAVTTERALLARLGELSGAPEPAAARVRVMSFNRLAHVLADRAGERISPLGELGRELTIWRLLPADLDRGERQARAASLSDVIAELALYGTTPADLRARAAMLERPDGGAAALAAKLVELAGMLEAYQTRCAELGCDYRPAAALIPRLLNDDNWPLLSGTQVWVDGFAGFTPAEEQALTALLRNCAQLTATLLIDPARLARPANDDWADWYEPTRLTYQRWLVLARAAGAEPEEVDVSRDPPGGAGAEAEPSLPRWDKDSPLRRLARDGLQGSGDAQPPAADARLRAVVCADERAEVDAAARQILDLATQGLRFSEISVVARSLAPYADLIAARFSEHGIPAFIDARRPLAGHPAALLLQTGLRLVLDQAGIDDPAALLRTGLLLSDGAAGLDAVEPDDRADQLVKYSRAHGLYPGDWLRDEAWHWPLAPSGRDDGLKNSGDGAAQERLAQLDSWRREFMAPVLEARRRLAGAGDPPTVSDVLAAAWECFVYPAVAEELERWAVACEQAQPPQPDKAALHRAALGRLAALWDELALLAGDLPLREAGGLGAAELCAWVEGGIGALSAGQPPPRLDSVLVTEIERGRHHPVRATLLLGLADGSWPPPAAESAYLSDAERRLLNEAADGEAAPLVGDGAAERARREPYLALVAATRAAEYLYMSRPGADSQGALRPASPYFTVIQDALGITEEAIGAASRFADSALVGTPGDLGVCAALRGGAEYAAALLGPFGATTAAARVALNWSRHRQDRNTLFAQFPAGALAGLLGPPDANGNWQLRFSPSRLETFAACPFKHYAHYYLGLEEEAEDVFDNRVLGGFYHRVLQRAIDALDGAGATARQDLAAIRGALASALDVSLAELAAGSNRLRLPYLAERAEALLSQLAGLLYEQFTAERRAPVGTEIRLGGAQAPALRCLVEGDGLRIELSGFIDRLDLAAGGATVVDYKMSGSEVDWSRFLSGGQIQLFSYMLAVAQSAAVLGEQPVHPAAIEYQPVEPDWKRGEADFRPQRVPPPNAQEQHSELLTNALAQTRRIILELAGRITSGEILAQPLLTPRGATRTACAMCEYRSVCRFDPLAGESYRRAPADTSSQLRDAIAAGEDFAGSALSSPPEVLP